MAKLIVYMLVVTIVLNGLTFVYVVTLGPDTETSADSDEGSASSRAGPSMRAGQDPLSGQVERVYREIKNLQTSMKRDLQTVTSRMGTLETRLQALTTQTEQLLMLPEEEMAPPPNSGDRRFLPSALPEEVGPGDTTLPEGAGADATEGTVEDEIPPTG